MPGPVVNPPPLGGSNQHQDTFSLPVDGEITITHAADPGGVANPKRQFQSWISEPTLGPNLALGQTVIPVSWSTLEANLNDGNVNTFVYNNSSPGSSNKWYGFDAGAPITATYVRWFDYISPAYRPQDYKIQGSLDNVIWDDLYQELNPPHLGPASAGHFVSLGGAQSYRYWRWLCLVGVNPTWSIINELELFNWDGSSSWISTELEGTIVSPTQTKLKNTTGAPGDFLVTFNLPNA